ncbi:MAG: Trp family transcriptional regulator [bacterium]|nr:Trp family transcriptional regulator [bacterium]
MKNVKEFNTRKDWVNFMWSKIVADIKNPQCAHMLNTLISAYEKEIIVNRLAALTLIKQGKSYKQIGEELWLSPTTIRSLKRVVEDNFNKEYKSYNTLQKLRRDTENRKRMPKNSVETLPFIDWIAYYASVFPKRNGPRWKFLK